MHNAELPLQLCILCVVCRLSTTGKQHLKDYLPPHHLLLHRKAKAVNVLGVPKVKHRICTHQANAGVALTRSEMINNTVYGVFSRH